MPTVIAHHDVKDKNHWLASPRRVAQGAHAQHPLRRQVVGQVSSRASVSRPPSAGPPVPAGTRRAETAPAAAAAPPPPGKRATHRLVPPGAAATPEPVGSARALKGSSSPPSGSRPVRPAEASASAYGRNGVGTPPATDLPARTAKPRALAACAVSRTSRDFPIPASPAKKTVPPRPTSAAARAACR